MNSELLVGGIKYRVSIEAKDGRFIAECLDFKCESGSGDTEEQARRSLHRILSDLSKVTERSIHQRRVDLFMRRLCEERRRAGTGEGVGQEVRADVGLCDRLGLLLRGRLILEETLETLAALGLRYSGLGLEIDPDATPDLVGIADGCFDLHVVVTGTLSAIGVPDLEGQRLVDENNLAKFAPGFTIREDGKLVKPPRHVPPDLAGLLGRSLNAEESQIQGDDTYFRRS